jgi:hypothetical protein
MEVYDLPIRAALRDNERDTTLRDKRLSVVDAGYGVQTGDDDRGIRFVERGTSRHVDAQLLKVLANSLRFGHDRLAARAKKQRIRSVKIRDAVDARVVSNRPVPE